AAIMSRRLAALGLDVAASRILLAGEQTLKLLAAERPGARVRLFAAPALHEVLAGLALTACVDDPDLVVLARDPAFGVEEMGETLRAVAGGARLIVTNTDHAHPGADGHPVPETGALLAALLKVRPDLPHVGIGKPEPALIRAALDLAGAEARDCVFIGDNPSTDGAAAARMGMIFHHIDRSADLREGADRC
ncbi:MAG: HAD family hydrolase, partial [Pikeienuella sp.]